MDANRLEESAREAQSRRRALAKAQADVDKAKRRSRRDAEETQRLAQRVGEIELRLIAARRESAAHADTTGIAAAFSQSPLVDAGAEALLALTANRFDQVCAGAVAHSRQRPARGRLAPLARPRIDGEGRRVGPARAGRHTALLLRHHREMPGGIEREGGAGQPVSVGVAGAGGEPGSEHAEVG
jgi:hypothetical protein